MLCFANYFIAAPKGIEARTQVPCQNVAVNQRELAISLIAVALFHLREQGSITMQMQPSAPVWLTALRPTATVGLEDELARVIHGAGGMMRVDELAQRHLKTKHSWPACEIVLRVAQWASYQGYGTGPPTAPTTWIRFSRGHDSGPDGTEGFVPNCQRIATLSESAQQTHTRWIRFRANEPALYGAIMDQCGRGLGKSRIGSKSW
jgi:hypothetical protein